jgi:KEOPS complex subunit Pcc1
VSWPHEADLSFDYETQARATAVAGAVGQEIGEIDEERSTAGLEQDGRTIRIHVDATDLVSLRAATNTWLGLVRVAEDTAATAAEQ